MFRSDLSRFNRSFEFRYSMIEMPMTLDIVTTLFVIEINPIPVLALIGVSVYIWWQKT